MYSMHRAMSTCLHFHDLTQRQSPHEAHLFVYLQIYGPSEDVALELDRSSACRCHYEGLVRGNALVNTSYINR